MGKRSTGLDEIEDDVMKIGFVTPSDLDGPRRRRIECRARLRSWRRQRLLPSANGSFCVGLERCMRRREERLLVRRPRRPAFHPPLSQRR